MSKSWTSFAQIRCFRDGQQNLLNYDLPTISTIKRELTIQVARLMDNIEYILRQECLQCHKLKGEKVNFKMTLSKVRDERILFNMNI